LGAAAGSTPTGREQESDSASAPSAIHLIEPIRNTTRLAR
jgi:hypothetical protein